MLWLQNLSEIFSWYLYVLIYCEKFGGEDIVFLVDHNCWVVGGLVGGDVTRECCGVCRMCAWDWGWLGRWGGVSVPRIEVGSTWLYIRENCFGENKVVKYGVVLCCGDVWALVIFESAIANDEPGECGMRKSRKSFFLVFCWVLSHTACRLHARLVFGFWFLVCYAATQLATQLHQRRIQVVRSNKVAWKRLTESNGTPAMDLWHMNFGWIFFGSRHSHTQIHKQTRNRTKHTSMRAD